MQALFLHTTLLLVCCIPLHTSSRVRHPTPLTTASTSTKTVSVPLVIVRVVVLASYLLWHPFGCHFFSAVPPYPGRTFVWNTMRPSSPLLYPNYWDFTFFWSTLQNSTRTHNSVLRTLLSNNPPRPFLLPLLDRTTDYRTVLLSFSSHSHWLSRVVLLLGITAVRNTTTTILLFLTDWLFSFFLPYTVGVTAVVLFSVGLPSKQPRYQRVLTTPYCFPTFYRILLLFSSPLFYPNCWYFTFSSTLPNTQSSSSQHTIIQQSTNTLFPLLHRTSD